MARAWAYVGVIGGMCLVLSGCIAGPTGASGRSGADGSSGSAGVDGSIGASGVPGASGTDGARGPAGLDGAAGTDGTDGARGPAGVDGADGSPGADGADGLPGADGADGSPGGDGAPGATGATGARGSDGATGVRGPTGAQGTPGATGAAGADGAAGASADLSHQYWVCADGESSLSTGAEYALSLRRCPAGGFGADVEMNEDGDVWTISTTGIYQVWVDVSMFDEHDVTVRPVIVRSPGRYFREGDSYSGDTRDLSGLKAGLVVDGMTALVSLEKGDTVSVFQVLDVEDRSIAALPWATARVAFTRLS